MHATVSWSAHKLAGLACQAVEQAALAQICRVGSKLLQVRLAHACAAESSRCPAAILKGVYQAACKCIESRDGRRDSWPTMAELALTTLVEAAARTDDASTCRHAACINADNPSENPALHDVSTRSLRIHLHAAAQPVQGMAMGAWKTSSALRPGQSPLLPSQPVSLIDKLHFPGNLARLSVHVMPANAFPAKTIVWRANAACTDCGAGQSAVLCSSCMP